MKLSKEELLQKVSDTVKDEEVAISLLEDISDSIDGTFTDDVISETLKRENEELNFKYEDLKRRYRERFLGSASEEEEDVREKKEVVEDDKKIIDVKEI